MSEESNSDDGGEASPPLIEAEPRGATDEEVQKSVENAEEMESKNTFRTWLQWLRN
jgi:hypothetical protein